MKKIILTVMIISISSVAFAATELSLNDCLDQALKKNETIAVQEKKVAEYRLKAQEKNAALLPALGLSASYNRLPYLSAAKAAILGSGLDDYNLSFTLKQPLYAGGKLRGEQESANVELKKAEDNLNRSRNDLRLNVAAAYYRAQHAAEALTAKRLARGHLENYYKRSKRLLIETRLPRLEDLLQIEVQLGNAVIEVESAETNYKEAIRSLLDLIYADEREIVLSDPLPLPLKEDPFADQDPLSSNYDYRGALFDLAVAKEAIGISKSALLPSLNLNAYTNWEWSQYPPSRDYTQWGISMEMLLFDFFKTAAKTGQTEKIYEQGLLKLNLLGRQLRLEYRNKLDALHSLRTRFNLATDNLDKAVKSLLLYEARAQSYTANSKQLLDAEQAALNARVNQLYALLNYNLTRLELNRLLGRAEQ